MYFRRTLVFIFSLAPLKNKPLVKRYMAIFEIGDCLASCLPLLSIILCLKDENTYDLKRLVTCPNSQLKALDPGIEPSRPA